MKTRQEMFSLLTKLHIQFGLLQDMQETTLGAKELLAAMEKQIISLETQILLSFKHEAKLTISEMVVPDVQAENYSLMVNRLAKPGAQIVNQWADGDGGARKAHLTHMVLGVAGEAGELVDAIKKHTMYNKDLDFNNVIEELGDLEFYLEGIRLPLGISRKEVLEANTKKLAKRYADMGYSDAQAQARADKTPTIPDMNNAYEEGSTNLESLGKIGRPTTVIIDDPDIQNR
jgi:NTP pyrophosphatase (non-canonical NTP hydrolase)